MENYFIGVDIGTTATKAALFDEKLNVIVESKQTYPLYRDAFGRAEESVEEIFQAVLFTIKQCSLSVPKKKICSVSFSSQMHSLIALSTDEELTELMTWADTRAETIYKQLKERFEALEVYQRTGTPIHPMSPLLKLIWLKEEKPSIYEKSTFFLDIKGYIFYRLFGVKKMDLSIASGTGILNLEDLSWDQKILKEFQLNSQKLPEIVSPYHIEQELSLEFQEKMRLSAETKFIWAGADGPMANLGMAAIRENQLTLTVGTSAAVRRVSKKIEVNTDGQNFCYALDENYWLVGGPSNSGGEVLRWLKDSLFENKKSIEEICQLASTVDLGSEGLIFHPYLGGERAPIWNASARANFFGLSYSHTMAHLSRAILEGIVLNLYDISQDLSGEPKEIYVNGGVMRSSLFLEIISDVFAKPVIVSEIQETGCLAAVLMAQKALNLITDFDRKLERGKMTYPNLKNHQRYQELFSIYKNLTEKLSSEYEALGKFRRGNLDK
ncbi:MAG: gluconokinase [Lactovum sp.]